MAHKNEIELNALLKAAGHGQTIDDFEKSTGLALTYPDRSKTYYQYIGIQNTDPFFASYASLSTVTLLPKDSATKGFTQGTLDKFNRRLKSKIAQRRKLNQIRSKAHVAIPEFISKSFGIDKELITVEEIKFDKYCSFVVGGATFSYYGTITDKSFTIYTRTNYTYENIYKQIVSIHNHFSDRQEGLLKPLEYDRQC